MPFSYVLIKSLISLPEGCDVASQFEAEIKMCLEAYSAVYYDDKDYLENWNQPASNGMILDCKTENTHVIDKRKNMYIFLV